MNWQPIETAKPSERFAHSTWVLVSTSDGRVTEATPYYMDGIYYIWACARGDNCRGAEDGRENMLRHTVTHWMPLPPHASAQGEDAKL